MTDLPEVAWLYAFPQEKPITWTWADWKEYKNSVKFLRADTAIPKADARVAFEQAVREAVEAERERCAQVALRHFGYEPSDEEMHTVMDIAAAIRAPQEPSE